MSLRRNQAYQQTRPKVYDQEEEILSYSGLKLNEELVVYDVLIELQGKTYKIHTYRCGDKNTKDLVLLHGYGGSSVLYYKMLKDLSQKFRVFCIDFIGMGLSSKEKFECKTTQETLEFLVGSIDKWRQAVNLDRFYLGGHSFGGYISAQYALHYPDRVKKLLLLSPVGITKHDQEPSVDDIKKDLGFFSKIMFEMVMKAWNNKMTPSKLIQKHPLIGRWLIRYYVHKQFNLKDREADLIKDFLLNMLSMSQGSEEAIHYILRPPILAAFVPLEDPLTYQMRLPVVCFFGEYDYMDSTGAQRIHYRKRRGEFSFRIVPDSAHQLTMQNPKDLSEQIILSVNA